MTNMKTVICVGIAIFEAICFVIYNRYIAAVFPERKKDEENLDELRKQALELGNQIDAAPSAEEPTAASPETTKLRNENAEEQKKYSFFQACVLSFAATIIFLGVAEHLYGEMSSWINYAKLVLLTLLLAICAVTDLKNKIIPNNIILTGLAVRAVMYVLEIVLSPQDVLAILKNDLIGVALGFGTLFLAFLISRSAIGFGDVKLFGMIGIISGAICTFSTLLFSLILNSAAAVILLITRKKNRKSGIPFAPAVFLGYLIAVFISRF